MAPAQPSSRAGADGGDGTLRDAALFGREVVHVDGLSLGRIAAIVHRLDGGRLAVVRRRGILPRWYFVALGGATVVDGAVVVSARYGRGADNRVAVAPGGRGSGDVAAAAPQ